MLDHQIPPPTHQLNQFDVNTGSKDTIEPKTGVLMDAIMTQERRFNREYSKDEGLSLSYSQVRKQSCAEELLSNQVDDKSESVVNRRSQEDQLKEVHLTEST